MTAVRSSLVATALLLSTFVPAASAATVELLVVDELDRPVADVVVGLTDVAAGRFGWARHRGTTNVSGQVTLAGVGPGRYQARLSGERGRFVQLEDHPSLRRPEITIEDAADVVQSKVRFVRGTPVVFRISAGGDELPSTILQLEDLDRNYRTEIRFRKHEIEREVRLVAGRWTAQVKPVPGYLLTDVEVNRTALPGHIASMDLPIEEQVWYVNFEYAAPARIWGQVYYEGPDFGLSVVAQLKEAGPWLPAVRARGGSIFHYASANPRYPKWDYEMVVPDGSWQVTVQGDDLESSDPPHYDLRLSPGEERRIDFTVRGSPSGRGRPIRVYVEAPDGKRLGEVDVEAWPPDADPRPAEPTAVAKTKLWGYAPVYGLGEGTFEFLAGAAGYVEGSLIAKPPEKPDGRLTVRLRSGATLHAESTDEGETRVVPVEASLTRTDEGASRMIAPDVVAWAAQATARSDETGHLWLRGVYSGAYRLEGRVIGDDASRHFVEFRASSGDPWAGALDVIYEGDETAEFEYRLAPAAAVTGQLHCADGTDLPQEADLLVLPATGSYAGTVASDWVAAAEHKAKDFVLLGDNRDGLEAGPLKVGAYHVLARPQEHNRWTWALGTEIPKEASVITLSAGGPTDLGPIAVDCAPAVAVRPLPPEGVELPDLAETNVYDPVGEIAGKVTRDDREWNIERARTVVRHHEVQFRDLPEGEASFEAVVRSPFFLPHPEVPATIEGTLERGKTLEIVRPVEIGGALDVILPEEWSGTAAVIRLTRDPDHPEQEPEVLLMEAPGAPFVIPSLAPGAYTIDVCTDPACERTPLRTERSEVVLGAFTTFEPR